MHTEINKLLLLMCSITTKISHQCAIGFSGVIFGLIVVDNGMTGAAQRSIFGFFYVPAQLYPWTLLVLWQVIMPGVSFLGHLCGVLVRLCPALCLCPAFVPLPCLAFALPLCLCPASVPLSCLCASALRLCLCPVMPCPAFVPLPCLCASALRLCLCPIVPCPALCLCPVLCPAFETTINCLLTVVYWCASAAMSAYLPSDLTLLSDVDRL